MTPDEVKSRCETNIRLLADIRTESMQLTDSIDTTDTFKKRLRERVAAGEYALRKALEDLQRSLAVATVPEESEG